MLDFDRIYHLGSYSLDKDTIDILGELDEELTYHVFIPTDEAGERGDKTLQ
jgi:hypothetical protein